MEGSDRYGVLTVTVLAVLFAAIIALVTRNAWTDDTPKTRVEAERPTTTTSPSSTTSTTLPPTTTTFAPRPSSTIARVPLTTAPRPVAPPGTAPAPPAPTTTTVATTPPPPPPPGGEERSENTLAFNYGPSPDQRSSGSNKSTSPTTTFSFIVNATQTGDSWDVGADVTNKSNRTVTFSDGIDVILHFSCNGQSEEVRLNNANYKSQPAGEGVRLRRAGFRPRDAGPGSCEMYGTLKFNYA